MRHAYASDVPTLPAPTIATLDCFCTGMVLPFGKISDPPIVCPPARALRRVAARLGLA